MRKKSYAIFETHPIIVITDFPIKEILSKPDLSGRLTKWTIDLGIYDIRYLPGATKKGQVMTDFLVEIQSFTTEPEQFLHSEEEFQAWVFSTDGASNSTGTRIGVVLEAPSRLKIEEARRLNFQATKNEAEYEALIYGLELAKHPGVKLLKVRSDSKLIVEQVAGRFKAKEPRMKAYFDKASALSCQFRSFSIK